MLTSQQIQALAVGDTLWCSYHNEVVTIVDTNEGHPAGDYRPMRVRVPNGQIQAIPMVYLELREPEPEYEPNEPEHGYDVHPIQ